MLDIWPGYISPNKIFTGKQNDCVEVKKVLKICKVVDLAVQCSAGFQGNRMQICTEIIVRVGMPYFYEFDTDTCETSHTFTPFTGHQIEWLLRFLCCWNKSVGNACHK